MWGWRLVLAYALFGLAVTGCSDGDTQISGSPTTATEITAGGASSTDVTEDSGGDSAGRNAIDACEVLPKADLERISGVTYSDGESSGGDTTSICRYLDENARQLVTVDIMTERAQVQMDNTLAAFDGRLEEMVEVGADAAYSNSTFSFYLLKGENFVFVDAQIPTLTSEQQTELAQTIANNLPS